MTNPLPVNRPAAADQSRPVVVGVLLTLVLTVASAAEARQSCPAASSTQYSGTLTLKKPVTYSIDLEPCQTVVVLVTASASNHQWGNGNIHFQIRNSASQELAWTQVVCGKSCNTSVPLPTAVAGHPMPGTRGTEGLAKDIVITATIFNFFGGPTASYTLTVNKSPRPGYNTGGTGFGNAPLIEARTEQLGSVHPLEPGQFYKVHLDAGQVIFLRGQATGHSQYGSHFIIDLYDALTLHVQNMVNQAAYGTVTFPMTGTGPLYKNTGPPADFYLRVRSQFWPTWDFRFTVATPTLTASPPSVTRGDTATFRIEDAPGGTFSGWQYITSGPAVGTITRTVNTGAVDWSGPVVASGTVKATVGIGGYGVPLELEFTVTPRSWAFPPKAATKRTAGSITPCATTWLFSDPATGAAGVGKTLFCLQFDFTVADVGTVPADGPNEGLKWVLDIRDTSDIPWGMHATAENPTSPWFLANCGSFMPGPGNACNNPVGIGFMDAAAYRDGVERHEVGPTNSHHAVYVQEMSNPAKNLKTNAEDNVWPAGTSDTSFRAFVAGEMVSLQQAISNGIAAIEPCSPQCDSTCTDYIGHGNVLVNGSFAACPVPAVVSPLSNVFSSFKGRQR
jgi:hypothetical protein